MARTSQARLRIAAQAVLDGLKPMPKPKPGPSVESVFKIAYKKHWGKPQFSNTWRKEVRNLFEKRISPTFGKRPLLSITAKDVRDWHQEMFLTPIHANRALSVLSRIFTFAEEEEIKPQGTNPCSLVENFPERTRKRFATPEELRRIMDALDREPRSNRKAVAFVYTLIFTGARPSALARAKWSDLMAFEKDFKLWGKLSIFGKTSMRTGEPEEIIIPPQAMDKIRELSTRSKTIFDIKRPIAFWHRIRKQACCETLWLRDLRRTFATIALSNGSNLSVIGELLNHKSTQTTLIYAKLLDETKVKTSNLIAESIEKLSKGAL